MREPRPPVLDLPPVDAAAFMEVLRVRLGAPDLRYAEPPTRLASGGEAVVDAFRLDGAPFDGPLVLRRLLPLKDPQQLRRERAVHAALRDNDFPVPRILFIETETEALGAPFLVAERVPGRILLDEVTRPQEFARRPSTFPRLIRDALFRVGPLLGEIQTRLHAVDPEALRRQLTDAGFATDAVGFDARLEDLGKRIQVAALAGLREGFEWLRRNRPDPDPEVICHGDLVFTNLCVDRGKVAGVFDWSNVCLAEPAYDVAATLARLSSRIPNLPRAVDVLARSVQSGLERSYLRHYRRRRPLDLDRVRYFESCWILSEMAWSGTRLRAGGVPDDAIEHRWLHRETLDVGVSRFRDFTGVALDPLYPDTAEVS